MTVMRRYNNLTIWFAAFLLVFSAGCSDYDKAGTNPTVTPPTVISVTPLSAASACSNTIVTATFSKAMNPATISGTTFTLAGPGAAAVSGAVTYDASSDTATFTPTATLALSTAYTATITTGATDMYGNALAGRRRIRLWSPVRLTRRTFRPACLRLSVALAAVRTMLQLRSAAGPRAAAALPAAPRTISMQSWIRPVRPPGRLR